MSDDRRADGEPTHVPPVGRLTLVETFAAAPGLLSYAGWQAIHDATRVLARDPAEHPSTPYLYQAGVELQPLAAPARPATGMDLLAPGGPSDRGRASALCELAEETAPGTVTYVLGPDDAGFARAVGVEAARRHVEVEFVLLAELPRGAELLGLVEVMRRLRDPDGGCPWDLQQDHASLAHYLLEETYELLDAIDRGDDADLAEELGDVLLQIVFHAQVATDRGAFGIDEVADGIARKLVHRHPHVFGDAEVDDAEEVQANWDRLKRAEKGRTGPFEGVPAALPALQLAADLQRKAAKLGFDWPDQRGAAAKVREELEELLDASSAAERDEELGDLVGAVVALARSLGVDPEGAARRAATRFRSRFETAVALAAERGLPTAELDVPQWLSLWAAAKERLDRA